MNTEGEAEGKTPGRGLNHDSLSPAQEGVFKRHFLIE